MKVSSIEMDGQPHEAVMPIPHGSKLIPFRAQAISSFTEFDKLCPAPEAPGRLTKAGFERNPEDPSYREMVTEYNLRRTAWMVITSLQDIEWDTVDSQSPGTWVNWEKDMRKAGFSEVVINRVVGHVMDVNALDEGKLERARLSFALGQGQKVNASSTLTTEPLTTPSGEPVSA